MIPEIASRTFRHPIRRRFITVVAIASVLGLLPLCATAAGDNGEADYRKYAVNQLDRPLSMDCMAKHAKYFSPASEAAGQVELASISKDGNAADSHRQALSRRSYGSRFATYEAPAVELTTSDGAAVNFAALLNSDRPVMLNFIFTTCTTICPVLSASFEQVQDLLGERGDDVLMISISIDPEYDTPAKLAAYAERFAAGDRWKFLTGKINHIVAVEKAFDIFRGSKTNHEPVTFLRAGGATRWLRLEGFAKAAEIVAEYEKLAAEDG